MFGLLNDPGNGFQITATVFGDEHIWGALSTEEETRETIRKRSTKAICLCPCLARGCYLENMHVCAFCVVINLLQIPPNKVFSASVRMTSPFFISRKSMILQRHTV